VGPPRVEENKISVRLSEPHLLLLKQLVRRRLLRKLLKKQERAPRVLITDKLKSYAAAKREIMSGVPLAQGPHHFPLFVCAHAGIVTLIRHV
jgi:hypothetical protein